MLGHVLLRGEHLLAEGAVDVLDAQVADLDVVVPDLLGGAPEVAVGAGEGLGPRRVAEALVDATLVQGQLGLAVNRIEVPYCSLDTGGLVCSIAVNAMICN